MKVGKKRQLSTKEMISIFPLSVFHLYVETQPVNGVAVIWYSRSCGSFSDFLNIGLLLTRKLLNHGVLFLKWNYHVEGVTIVTWPGWSYFCVTNDHGYESLVVILMWSFDHACFITVCVARYWSEKHTFKPIYGKLQIIPESRSACSLKYRYLIVLIHVHHLIVLIHVHHCIVLIHVHLLIM
jgi:hypothetical protein